MDDLAGKLNEILNNPAEMEKFQQMANSLMGQINASQQDNSLPAQQPQVEQQAPAQSHSQQNQPSSGGFDLSQLSSLLGQSTTSAPAQQNNYNHTTNTLSTLGNLGGLGNALSALGGNNGASPEMLNTLMKIAPLLGTFNQEDDNTRLLYALRPLLKIERQKKLDEAIKIMRMLRFLPILKEQGILQGIL